MAGITANLTDFKELNENIRITVSKRRIGTNWIIWLFSRFFIEKSINSSLADAGHNT